MIKYLGLKKALIVVALGIIALISAKIMEENKADGRDLVLGISGGLLIVGALMFLYPILFAKKADKDGKNVKLTPISEEDVD
jgi:hypothetical protein